jgi:hypothetical protein
MATPGKKVTNQGAIAAAQSANAAAQANAAAAQARAAAADAARKPVLKQTVAGIGGINKATQAAMAVINNPKSSQAQIDKALAEAKAASAAQKANLASITPEQRTMAIEQGQIYTSAMSDVERYNAMMVNVPGAVYEEEITTNLSEEAFISTLKLLMGAAEASKPYVKQLYNIVSKYYKSGSTIPDSINLALYDAKENKLIPEFTNRFSGIFKLADRRAAGEVIDVPTLAEYVKSQEAISEVLRRSSLGDLANETFLNEVMGTGKSVLESTRIIADVFDAVDNAPKEWSDMVKAKMPFASRTDLGRALLLGAEGAADLERKVNRYGIMAAAQSQGLTVGEQAAGELLAKGQGYASAKPKFGQAAAILPTAQKLTSMETGIEPTKAYTQEQAFSAVFDQNYQSLQNIQNLSEREQARFGGRAGRLASRDRAAGQI